MNPEQLTQQLVYLLGRSKLVWPDSPGDPVLGRVVPAPAPASFFMEDARTPFALVSPAGEEEHPEHVELVEVARWQVAVLVAVATYQGAGAAVTGGNRQGLGKSQGRGLLEIEAAVRQAIRAGTGGLAVSVAGVSEGAVGASDVPGVVVARALEVLARRIPSQPSYDPITRLLATGGAGSVALSWTPPCDRFDLVGVQVNRAAGPTPPSSPSSGTVVATAARQSTGYVDAPGAGQWSYAVFGAYNAFADPTVAPAGTVNSWSAGSTATVTA